MIKNYRHKQLEMSLVYLLWNFMKLGVNKWTFFDDPKIKHFQIA